MQTKEQRADYQRQYRLKNREQNTAYMRQWRIDKPELAKIADRRLRLRKKFGMTVGDYDQLLVKQSGVCAVCGRTCATGHRLAVDHDHATGRIRGLLCMSCNRNLGIYEKYKGQFDLYLAGTL